MSSDPTSTQGQTGSSADDLPNFGPTVSFLQSFARHFQDQLDRINNLPAMHDGARWVQLSTQVDRHQNTFTTFQRTVRVTQDEVTAFGNVCTALRDEVTTLRDQNTTFRDELAALRRDLSGAQQNVSLFQGDMGSLREEFIAFRGQILPLSQQTRSLSATTANESVRLTDSIRDQAEVNMRQEAILIAAARRMAEILGELGEPRQAVVNDRRRELRKLYGAEFLNLRIVGERGDD
ncbi:hypothetical protein E4U31_006631 [Claviceps sp. LM219 group G6]|nr:hypothetical protein E4U31_006631 [Claviceps sp. LM219 group G6]